MDEPVESYVNRSLQPLLMATTMESCLAGDLCPGTLTTPIVIIRANMPFSTSYNSEMARPNLAEMTES